MALNGRVPGQAEWRALGQVCGYTARRDLAGFYGGHFPSMIRTAGRLARADPGRLDAGEAGLTGAVRAGHGDAIGRPSGFRLRALL